MSDALIGRALLALDLKTGNITAKFAEQMRTLKQVGGSQASGFAAAASTAMNVAKTGIEVLGGAVVGASIYSLKLARDFQSAMTLVQTQAGYTRAQLDQLTPGILKMSGEFGVSATDLANGLYHIASSAIPADQALAVLRATTMLAKVGNSDLETTTNAVTAALKAYGKTGKDAQSVADVLNATVGAGNMRMEDLASSIGLVLPSAAKMGVSLEEVGANLATLTQKGVNTHEAVTALNGVFGAFTKTGTSAKKALESIGLTTDEVRKKIGPNGEGLAAFIQELDARTHGNIETMAKIIPNIRALRDILGTTGASTKDYTAALAYMNSSHQKGQNLVAQWAVTQKDFNTKMDQAREKVNGAAIAFGNKLMPYIERALPVMADLASRGIDVLVIALDKAPAAFNAVEKVIRTVTTAGQNFETNMKKWAPVLEPVVGFIVTLYIPTMINFAVITGIRAVQATIGFAISIVRSTVALVAQNATMILFNARLMVAIVQIAAARVATAAWTVVQGAHSAAMGIWFLIQNGILLSTMRYVAAQTLAKIGTAAWTAMQWLLNIALDANPIGIVIVVIAALAAATIYMYTHNKKFKDTVDAVFGRLREFVSWAWSSLQPLFKSIGDWAGKAGDALNAINPFARHSPSLVDNVSAGTAIISQHYGNMADQIAGHADRARGAIQGMAGDGSGLDVGSGAYGGSRGPGDIVMWLQRIHDRLQAIENVDRYSLTLNGSAAVSKPSDVRSMLQRMEYIGGANA